MRIITIIKRVSGRWRKVWKNHTVVLENMKKGWRIEWKIDQKEAVQVNLRITKRDR